MPQKKQLSNQNRKEHSLSSNFNVSSYVLSKLNCNADFIPLPTFERATGKSLQL